MPSLLKFFEWIVGSQPIMLVALVARLGDDRVLEGALRCGNGPLGDVPTVRRGCNPQR